MRAVLLLFLISLTLCVDLPHKYMALRGFDIDGGDIEYTGIKNVLRDIVSYHPGGQAEEDLRGYYRLCRF